MNPKSTEHFDFLSSLTYYDASEFVLSSNQSLPKSQLSQSNLTQKKEPQNFNESEIQDIFSMQYTKEFNQLKEFIESPQENIPLLIKSPKHTGKKTLLCQCINHYQKHSKTKIFIANFSSVNKVYSQILYSIMVKLRITFGINQKVEVNEEKIRRFFKYWLDITSQQIQKDNIGYSKSEKQTLCIIIEGIDHLTNSMGEKVFPQFWLPQNLPKNVRLILSGTQGEMSIEKLYQEGHVKLLTLSHKVLSEKLKSKLKPQIRELNENRQLSLFEIKTLSWFLKVQEKLTISPTATFHQIMEAYIAACSSTLQSNEIKSLILILCLSKKGLTEGQLCKIMRMEPEQVEQFLHMFEPLIDKLEKFEGYFLITNEDVKEFIQKVYDPNRDKRPKYHEIIGKVIKKGQLSIRKIQEEIYHLKMAENFFEIKEVVTQIENFLVLYTPPCKYLLCSIWKMLETHLNSDPVFEYNKAIESFLTHYHPKEEQLFKIIFQLSMFFREYSEFEGAKIPSFKHPLIKGDDEQLQQICVFEELKHHKMTSNLKIVVKKNLDIKNSSFSKSKEMKIAALSPRKQSKQHTSISSELELGSSASKHSDSRQQSPLTTRQCETIEEIQCLNLQIKQNREKFKEHYLKILKPYLKEFYIPVKKLMHNDKFVKSSNSTHDQEEDTEDLSSDIPEGLAKDLPSHLERVKASMILKNLDQYFEENYHREEISQFYYYKEWMWIQFPWICQSLNYDFSEMIQKYIASPTEYMSMDVELALVRDVMKISQVSKENKSAIYENKNIQLLPINQSKLKKNKRPEFRNSTLAQNVAKELTEKQSIRLSVNPSVQKRKQTVPIQVPETLNNSNLAKFELNLSEIDQKLNFEIQKEMTHRQAYDSRVLAKSRAKLSNILNNSANHGNYSTPFLTESNHNKENSSMILPKINYKLSQSRFGSESRSKLSSSKIAENKTDEDPKRTRLLTELNDIMNQNQYLKKMIQNIQKTSLMLDNINQEPQKEQVNHRIAEFNTLKQKMQKKQQNQTKLKEKLETIIKICDNNKSHEKESQLLCTFLDNLKTMCGIQEKQKEITMKEFVQYAEKYRDQINSLSAKKNALVTELKQCGGTVRLLTERILEEEDEQATEKTLPSNLSRSRITKKDLKVPLRQKQHKVTYLSKHESISSIKRPMKDRNRSIAKITSKNTVQKNLKPEPPAAWEQLTTIFMFDPSDYEQSVQNSHYMIEEFKEKITKFRELSFMYEELAYEGDSLDDRIQNLEEELNTMRQKNDACIPGSKGNRGSLNQSEEIKEKMKHLEEIKRRSEILEQCLVRYTAEENQLANA